MLLWQKCRRPSSLPVICAGLIVAEQALFELDVFEMAAPIQSTAKSEVRSVKRFLNAKGERPAEIHKKVVVVCGNVMNGQNVTKWRNISLGKRSTTMMRCKKKS